MAHLKIDIADLRSNELVRQPKQFRSVGTPGGSTPNPTATPIRYAKLAQIVDGELRCFEFGRPTGTPGGVLAGDDLQTFAPIDQVIWPESSDYLCNGQPPVPAPNAGDMLEILSGPDAGIYAMLSFASCRQARLDSDMTSSSGGFNLPWRIEVADQPPDPDAPLVPNYSKVIKARAVPGSPLHRYRPYLGPGDHTGADLATTSGIATFTHQGSDGIHQAGQDLFATPSGVFLGDADADPPIPPVNFGDILEVLSGPEPGSYLITQVNSDTNLITDHVFTNTTIDVNWQIVVADPNAPGASPTATSESANFTDPLNPVVPGMYIEIEGGPDAGRHEIIAVLSMTQLELASGITADATGLSYRIDIVSDHATTLQIVPVSGGQLIAVPDQDSIEVKIAQVIRDEIDAANFDTFRELGTTEAVDLFNEMGAYLACYRLWSLANQQHGLPVDDRVIIAALPWRGRFVTSVLYLDDNGNQKYDLSDPDEPVWPIRWLRTHWRLEDAIAEDEDREPTAGEVCP